MHYYICDICAWLAMQLHIYVPDYVCTCNLYICSYTVEPLLTNPLNKGLNRKSIIKAKILVPQVSTIYLKPLRCSRKCPKYLVPKCQLWRGSTV